MTPLSLRCNSEEGPGGRRSARAALRVTELQSAVSETSGAGAPWLHSRRSFPPLLLSGPRGSRLPRFRKSGDPCCARRRETSSLGSGAASLATARSGRSSDPARTGGCPSGETARGRGDGSAEGARGTLARLPKAETWQRDPAPGKGGRRRADAGPWCGADTPESGSECWKIQSAPSSALPAPF